MIYGNDKKRISQDKIAKVITRLEKAQSPCDSYDAAAAEARAAGLALAMDKSADFEQFEKVYDEMDITVFYLEGRAAFIEHVRELLRIAKKNRS